METAALPPNRPVWSLASLKEVIARHWGFRDLRPLQEPAMRAAPDGRYALVIRADRVRDCLGNPLDGDGDGAPDGDRVEHFFRLYGDSDGHGDVDDLATKRSPSCPPGATGRSPTPC